MKNIDLPSIKPFPICGAPLASLNTCHAAYALVAQRAGRRPIRGCAVGRPVAGREVTQLRVDVEEPILGRIWGWEWLGPMVGPMVG